MALTNYWFTGPNNTRHATGTWVLTRPSYGGFTRSGLYEYSDFAKTVRVTVGGTNYDFTCPYVEDDQFRLNINANLGVRSSGTNITIALIGILLTESVSITAPLPQGIAGTQNISILINNGWYWGANDGYAGIYFGSADKDITLDDGGTPPTTTVDALFFGHGL